jgi:hypothetical protein
MKKVFSGIVMLSTVLVCSENVRGAQGGAGDLPEPPPILASPSVPKRTPSPGIGPAPSSPSRMAPAQLTVVSQPPGCLVLVDGEVLGTTDHDGVLELPKLEPKRSSVVVRRDRYRESQRTINLVPGESMSLSVSLVPHPGWLDVSTSVAGTHIEVRGVGKYIDSTPKLELAPGTYQIALSNFGYRDVTLDVEIEPGGTFRVRAGLAPLTGTDLALSAEEDFNAGRYDRVIATCQRMLAETPDKAEANLMMGASYFRTGRYRESVDPLAKAVRAGELITIPVRLEDRSNRNKVGAPCSGYLILTNNGLGFRAVDQRPELDFFIPLSKVVDWQTHADRIRINVGIGELNRVSFAIDSGLDVTSGILGRSERKDKDSSPVFTTPDTGLDRQGIFDVYPVEAGTAGSTAAGGGPGAAGHPATSAAVEVLHGLLQHLKH